MDVNHPDVHDFIDIKMNLDNITHANISLKVSDMFMTALRNKQIMKTRVVLADEETQEIWHTKEVETDPQSIIDHIAENNWKMGEPGIIFWDRMKNYNFFQYINELNIAGVNPCGELPLPSYGSCNLGSINLSAYVKQPFTPVAEFDFDRLSVDVEECVVALNDVLLEGKDYHPIEGQRQAINKYRQIGLGITGLADCFIKMNYKYGDKLSLDLITKIYRVMVNSSVKASVYYADCHTELGSFEGFNLEKVLNSDFALQNLDEETITYMKEYECMFNSQLLTIPPAGSISILLECSSGVEPNFEFEYDRRITSLYDEPKIVHVTSGILKEYNEYKSNTKYAVETELPTSFVTAMQGVTWKDKIAVQGACQSHIDGSISSTVNLPEEATVQDIKDLYMYAYARGLKGVTVYRDNCSREGILTTKKDKEEVKSDPKQIMEGLYQGLPLARGEKKPIAEDTIYHKREVLIGCGELNLFLGWSDKEQALQDFWVKMKGRGGCERNIEGVVIAMSLLQRVGGSFEMLSEAFDGIGSCNSFTRAIYRGKQCKGSNCPQAIYNTVREFVKDMNQKHYCLKHEYVEPKPSTIKPHGVPECLQNFVATCPDCGTVLSKVGGCVQCSKCGYIKCD